MSSFVGVFIVVFCVSFAICLFLIYLSENKRWFIDKKDNKKPQVFHARDTSRSGGIGIIAGFLVGSLLFAGAMGIKLLLASLPLVVGGLLEDANIQIRPRLRLMLAFASAGLGIAFTGFVVKSLGFILFINSPYLVSLMFTVFAVAGVANSVNIIDGFNGLASGFSLIALAVFAFTYHQLHDIEMFRISVVLISAMLGFFILNFPKGKIFLGDGGAYFLGFMLAELSVALVWRHPNISPWFCLAVMIYPVWEVVFSFYRRKILKNVPAMLPDRMHLHSIVYRRVTHSNPTTSIFILLSILPFEILSYFFKANTFFSILVTLAFVVVYTVSYNVVVRRKKARKHV